jgi:hypothetical protein
MRIQFDSGHGERSGKILDSLPDPIFFFDDAGELRYANAAAEALIGGSDGSIRRFCDLIDCNAYGFTQLIEDIRRGAAPDCLRSRPELEKDGASLLYRVKPVDGGVVCTLACPCALRGGAGTSRECQRPGELHCQAEDMRLIYDLLRKISRSINLDETLDGIVKSMPVLLRLDSCLILFLHDREISVIKSTEYVEKRFGKLRFNIDDLIATREAVDKKHPVVINDARNDPDISQQIVEMFNASAVLVMPLIARDRTLGVMWLSDSTVGRHFTELEIEEANLISGQAAIAMDNAMLFKQLSQANRQLEESYERAQEPGQREDGVLRAAVPRAAHAAHDDQGLRRPAPGRRAWPPERRAAG